MKTINNITIFGDLENSLCIYNEDVYKQMDVAAMGNPAVLCADNHLGYRMPIGGVVAYEDFLSPSGVGYDIGCGNNAVRTSLKFDDIQKDIPGIAQDIANQVEFGLGSKGDGERNWQPGSWKHNSLLKDLESIASTQLGSVGGGNHYIDVFVDNERYVWVANHFGSRGFGHTIAKRALQALGMKDSIMGVPALIESGTPLFDDYLEAMIMACNYAQLGRSIVINKVLKILGTEADLKVNNHHNFARREIHFNTSYWVIRKGATPIAPGQRSFIGGSMGDVSVIVSGLRGADAEISLWSAPHGAGRVISRSKAKKQFTEEQMREAIKHVYVIGGDLDESPMAYRNLANVIRAHPYLHIEHALYPVIVVMAGKDIRDPYKD